MDKQSLIINLRKRDLPIETFRHDADELARLFAIDSKAYLKRKLGSEFLEHLVLVPILRSGLIMLPAFLQIYPRALVGLIGAVRDEKTALPHLYYQKLPRLEKKQRILLLDPMLATGGSAVLAAGCLKQLGIEEKQITLFSLFAAPEGMDYFKEKCPQCDLVVAQIEKHLDQQKFIVPGVGDFGDRYFGTYVS